MGESEALKDGGANGWKKPGALNDHVDQRTPCPHHTGLHRECGLSLCRVWSY